MAAAVFAADFVIPQGGKPNPKSKSGGARRQQHWILGRTCGSREMTTQRKTRRRQRVSLEVRLAPLAGKGSSDGRCGRLTASPLVLAFHP
jgi:hypothetical protein